MNNILEIFKLFIRLGVVAFGGPAAHIAMVHNEVVEKRKWMDDDHFVDLVGATALIPGPNSTEMVIHAGYHRGGVAGLIVAGVSFILPACLLTGLLAYFHVQMSNIEGYHGYLLGIKPVAVLLIVQALQKLWKKAIKRNELLFITGIVFLGPFLGVGEVASLFLGTLAGFLILKMKTSRSLKSIEPISIFLVFLKVGSVLFGSGYVLIAYLQDELIHRRGWITISQLADAIAIGQFTPGPVLSTSTFIGYIMGGSSGAVLASIGIFLPSFIFVLILNPIIPKMRSSKTFGLLLDCVNAGAVGLMGYAVIPLSKATFDNYYGAGLFIILAVIVYKLPKISSIKLVSLSLVLGFVVNLLKISF